MKQPMKSKDSIWKDWVDLDQLHFLSKGDHMFVKNMLQIYMEDFPWYLQRLTKAVELNSWSEIKHVGHKMKSPAAIVRVRGMYQLLDFFENADTSSAPLLVRNLELLTSLHSKIMIELNKEMTRLMQLDPPQE